jgi:hypothetical protein
MSVITTRRAIVGSDWAAAGSAESPASSTKRDVTSLRSCPVTTTAQGCGVGVRVGGGTRLFCTKRPAACADQPSLRRSPRCWVCCREVDQALPLPAMNAGPTTWVLEQRLAKGRDHVASREVASRHHDHSGA